jgi:hypothetical protein
MGQTQRITKKFKVTVSEYQSWMEYDGGQGTDCEEWIETDQITTAKKASLGAYLRGLANELDPPKTTTRGYDA